MTRKEFILAVTAAAIQCVECAAHASRPGRARDPVGEMARFLRLQVAPDTYIEEKIKRYPVVMMGENHTVEEDVLLFLDIIPKACDLKVRDIVLEVGSRKSEKALNAMLQSSRFEKAVAFEALFGTADWTGWPYRKYPDIFRRIWRLNCGLKENDKIRVHMPVSLDWSTVADSADFERQTRTYDRDMADRILSLRRQGRRVLYYAGTAHLSAGTQHHVGGMVKAVLPGEVFCVICNWPHGSYDRKRHQFRRTAWGVLDRALVLAGSHPCGFDLLASNLAGRMTLGHYEAEDVGSTKALYEIWDGIILHSLPEDLHFTGIVEAMLTPAHLSEMRRRVLILNPGLGPAVDVRQLLLQDKNVERETRMLEPLTDNG